MVVDEIGSMEMLSEQFCEEIPKVLAGPTPLLASIRQNAQPFTSQIKKMSDTQLVTLTRANFLNVKNQVRHWIEDKCRP